MQYSISQNIQNGHIKQSRRGASGYFRFSNVWRRTFDINSVVLVINLYTNYIYNHGKLIIKAPQNSMIFNFD